MTRLKTDLGNPEKLRSQFLSLRQPAQGWYALGELAGKPSNTAISHLSSGGLTLTAERTVGSARMIVGELDTQTRN